MRTLYRKYKQSPCLADGKKTCNDDKLKKWLCTVLSQIHAGHTQNYTVADTQRITEWRSSAITGRGSWRNTRPPAARLLEDLCSEPSSELLSGRKEPAVTADEDAELSPASQWYNTLIGPIPWDHSGPLCRALSLSSLWTSMRRQWRHLVNWREMARCGEWAHLFQMLLFK